MAATSSHPDGLGDARAVARLIDPLIADALALGRRLEQYPLPSAGPPGHPPPARFELLAVFADQLRASAALMRACVHPAGCDSCGCQTDQGVVDGTTPADDVPAPRGESLRRLLHAEDLMARRLRRAIATCDVRADDWTADRLEEVLDEVERQRWYLADLLSEPTE